jgi:hypothetical protein
MQSQYQSQDKNKGISLMENITKLQEEYYEKNNKNILFKKNQKYDCNILFEKTLYILKNGEVYFDYTIFKTYIHPEIFDNFLEYINNISLNYIDIMSEYTLHLNFQTLTISAFDRYWPLVKQIMNTFPVNVDKMQKTYIYYTPSVIDQIIKVMHPFISHYRDKITFFSKSESSEKISELFR